MQPTTVSPILVPLITFRLSPLADMINDAGRTDDHIQIRLTQNSECIQVNAVLGKSQTKNYFGEKALTTEVAYVVTFACWAGKAVATTAGINLLSVMASCRGDLTLAAAGGVNYLPCGGVRHRKHCMDPGRSVEETTGAISGRSTGINQTD
ncbi:hypothetical protein BaRGS_00026731 [Batillaria attramentaria]|uniref:Uncharacterized protein n=1 Tax=Batillaria attramentaria TaxID=370345 RepID=A0ABD0K4Q0_9CAEN